MLRTAAAHRGGIYGYAPNVSSWGGSLVTDAAGLHHLFAAEIPGGLRQWASHSQCIHATSTSPTGPFTRKDTVLKPWCHGPQVVQDPTSKGYVMVHVGTGELAPPLPGAVAAAAAGVAAAAAAVPTSSGFMHHSASLDGPWLPAATSPGSCGMPSAAYHPNGTLFVVCGNGHAITRATSPTSTPAWESTWSPQVPLTPHGEAGNWEDPDLWFDRRENFHILYHVYTTVQDWHVQRCSGHGWSRDGSNWTFSSVQPFNCTVAFDDGTSRAFATRERPV